MSSPAAKQDTAHIEAMLTAAAGRLPGGDQAEVVERRRRAAAWFAARGLPSRRDELWKYTDLSRLAALLGERLYQPPVAAPVDVQAFAGVAIAGLEADEVRFAAGHRYGKLPEAPAGVRLHPLAEILAQRSELLAVDEQAPLFNSLNALNAALAGDGVCLEVPAGMQLARPLYLLHAAGAEHAAHIRHHIRLGEGARATVIEHFAAGTDAAGLTNVVCNIELAAGAALTHYRLQEEGTRRFHIGRVDVRQQQDSRYVSHAIHIGAALARTDIVVHLQAQGCRADLGGLYMTAGRQHTDCHTHIDHRKPHCSSRELYKGVVDGRSRAVFNGKVMVHAGAVGTDADLVNRNLLLSRQAEVDSKPELEIYADDVKCAHGATVGQLDEAQLFYLRSRGIAESQARNVLIYAFADDVIARMQHAPIRRYMEAKVLGRLPMGEALKGLL